MENVAQLRDILRSDHFHWVDVQGLGDEEVLRDLAAIFELHPLVLSDIVNVPQRPKTETYDGQQLVITRKVRLDGPTRLEADQVSLILGKNYLLTFQERHGDALDPVLRRLQEGKGPMRRSGTDYLAYAVLDTIIDTYYPVLEDLGDFLEHLEDRVLESPGRRTLKELTSIKSVLVQVRRAIWPQRDMVNTLIRDANPLISDHVRVYLRDTYDHCIQTAEVSESYRELVSGLMNTYLSVVSNHMNEVMKMLTLMASIFIPLTFLAGIYGMNFENMPELQAWWAYPAVLATMLATAAGMLLYFRRRGWIGYPAEDPDEASNGD